MKLYLLIPELLFLRTHVAGISEAFDITCELVRNVEI